MPCHRPTRSFPLTKRLLLAGLCLLVAAVSGGAARRPVDYGPLPAGWEARDHSGEGLWAVELVNAKTVGAGGGDITIKELPEGTTLAGCGERVEQDISNMGRDLWGITGTRYEPTYAERGASRKVQGMAALVTRARGEVKQWKGGDDWEVHGTQEIRWLCLETGDCRTVMVIAASGDKDLPAVEALLGSLRSTGACRKGPCDEARYFYSDDVIASVYKSGQSAMLYERDKMVSMMLDALKRYEREALRTGDAAHLRGALQDPSVDAPRLAAAFYAGAAPTGGENRLRQALVTEHERSGKRLEPGDVLYHALKVSEGNLRDALVTAHAILYRNGKTDKENTNKAFIAAHLVPLRDMDAYVEEPVLEVTTPGGKRKVSPRQALDDQQGPWYHVFGLAAVELQDASGLVPFSVQRWGVEDLSGYVTTVPPNVKELKGRPVPSELGTEFSNYCVFLENATRSAMARPADPDKQCYNYTGIAIGRALREHLVSRDEREERAADRAAGIKSGTPPLGPVFNPRQWTPGEGSVSIMTRSPVSVRIRGKGGEEFVFDQQRKVFSGNTVAVLVDVVAEADGTWGLLATPAFPVQELELRGVKSGEAVVGVYRYSDRKVRVEPLRVEPGDRLRMVEPGRGTELPPLEGKRGSGTDAAPKGTGASPGSGGSSGGARVEPEGKGYVLEGPSSSFLLARRYPRTGLRIRLDMSYTRPGVLLDTVGIDAAPVGSFAMTVTGEGRVMFQVYDPGQPSAIRIANGWHVLTSRDSFAAGQTHRVEVVVDVDRVTLLVNGREQARARLNATLSGRPVYLGDIPADDHWGEGYNIHPALTGQVRVRYFGPVDE